MKMEGICKLLYRLFSFPRFSKLSFTFALLLVWQHISLMAFSIPYTINSWAWTIAIYKQKLLWHESLCFSLLSRLINNYWLPFQTYYVLLGWRNSIKNWIVAFVGCGRKFMVWLAGLASTKPTMLPVFVFAVTSLLACMESQKSCFEGSLWYIDEM